MPNRPLYERIFQDLLRQIRQGRFAVGEKIPTEAELVRHYGVSRITIRRALSQLENEGLLRRIAGRGSFVTRPETHPKSLNHGAIGMILPDFSESYGLELVTGVERACREAGIPLFLSRSETSVEVESRAIERLLSVGCSGLILMPQQRANYNADFVRLILDDFPVVILDRKLTGIQAPCISSDNESIVYQMTMKLLELGHRDIALVSNPIHSATTLSERYQGFIRAFREHKILWNDSLLYDGLLDPREDVDLAERIMIDHEGIKRFIQDHPKITCIFVTEYHLSQMVLLVCEDLGLKIPEDISIVGYDGPRSITGNYILTRILQPQEEMGTEAVKILQRMIAGEDFEMPKPFPSRILEGRSLTIPRV